MEKPKRTFWPAQYFLFLPLSYFLLLLRYCFQAILVDRGKKRTLTQLHFFKVIIAVFCILPFFTQPYILEFTPQQPMEIFLPPLLRLHSNTSECIPPVIYCQSLQFFIFASTAATTLHIHNFILLQFYRCDVFLKVNIAGSVRKCISHFAGC